MKTTQYVKYKNVVLDYTLYSWMGGWVVGWVVEIQQEKHFICLKKSAVTWRGYLLVHYKTVYQLLWAR